MTFSSKIRNAPGGRCAASAIGFSSARRYQSPIGSGIEMLMNDRRHSRSLLDVTCSARSNRMMTTPAFANVEEAFLYCRDMDASLAERLDAFSLATRYLIPGYQEAVDRMVNRLKAYNAGQAAPKPGEPMPPFAMPNEQGHMVTLDDLLSEGSLAMTF